MLGYDGIVKLCDFGCSKLIKDLDEKMNAKCGTPAFIAPEILIGKGYYGFQADIWSAGVVLYYILYGYKPFTGKDMNQISRAVVKAKYQLKADISIEARHLIQGMMERDPQKRLTVKQVLNHKWLQKVKDDINLFDDYETTVVTGDADASFSEHNLDSTFK